MRYSYGIDLGTTNSAIVGFDSSAYRIFKNRQQMDVTPSAVYVDQRGRLSVGRAAYEAAFLHPSDVALEFKRLMGTKDMFAFESSGRNMSPEELSSELLKALLADAQRFADSPIDFVVITIPAAFRALQCEATNKAAVLAAIHNPSLLMEPVAASIGFGADKFDLDEKWMVYDLGGGTFDVAIVSHENNMLSVIEHSGNNMLGGKNLDEKIIDTLLLPRMDESFRVPKKDKEPTAHLHLRRQLKAVTESLKMDLSTSDFTTVYIDDIGSDLDGKDYCLRFDVTRQAVDHIATPLILETVFHCREVLKMARLDPSSISRILLVGGPTQMPVLREILSEEFAVALDYSIDPMTVVAKGAAAYAAVVEPRQAKRPQVQNVGRDTVNVELSFQPVSASAEPLVTGRIQPSPSLPENMEILFEANNGFWTGAWIPVVCNQFETRLFLQERTATSFSISVRDRSGRRIACVPDQIVIRHGVEFDDFKLPYTISIFVTNPDGSETLDPILKRNVSLPAKQVVHYAAVRTLLPGSDDALEIHVFEGEVMDSPQANERLFTIRIRGEEIQRPVPVGSKIDIIAEMNASRILKVSAYIESLDLTLSDRFVPEDSQQDIALLSEKTRAQLDYLMSELSYLDQNTTVDPVSESRRELEHIKDRAFGIDIETGELSNVDLRVDPDRIKRIHEDVQRLNRELYRLKREAGLQAEADLESLHDSFEEVSSEVRASLEQKKSPELIPEFNRTYRDGCKCYESQIVAGLKKCVDKMNRLKWQVRSADPDFWRGSFEYFCGIRATLKNRHEADRLIALGREHMEKDETGELRRVVWDLWDLLPDREAQERAYKSGIRRT